MKKYVLPIRIVLVCTLLAGFVLALPQPAAACTGVCKNVAPPGEFCRRCVDAGVWTGHACQDLGSCGCQYLECAAAAPSLSTDEEAGEGTALVARAEPAPLSSSAAGQCAAASDLPATQDPATD